MRKTLLVNLLSLLLLPHAVVAGQTTRPAKPTPPAASKEMGGPNGTACPANTGCEAKKDAPAEAKKPDTPPEYQFNETQGYHADAIRQKIWHWQDRLNEAFGEFYAFCEQTQKDNKWPKVTCNYDTLTVTALPPAPQAAATPPPAQPPAR